MTAYGYDHLYDHLLSRITALEQEREAFVSACRDALGPHRATGTPEDVALLGRDRDAARGFSVQFGKERDAAVADNAAKTETIQRMRNLLLYPTMDAEATRLEVLRVGLDAVTHPRPGAALLDELMTLRGVQAQAQVDAKFIHDALGWTGEWPRSLPAPSRAVVALLEEHRKEIGRWQENVDTVRGERDTERQLRLAHDDEHRKALESQQAESHTLRRAFLHERHRADTAGAPPEHAYNAKWAENLLADERKALARARNEGLEMAAKHLDDERMGGAFCAYVLSRCAEAIRALKEPEHE